MTYAAPKLSREKTLAIEQGWFDFLVPYKNAIMLSPQQAAKSLNRTEEFVYQLIYDGKLEAHGVPGRDKQRYTITKRSLLLYMVESANYCPNDLVDRLVDCAATLTEAQIAMFEQKLKARRGKI